MTRIFLFIFIVVVVAAGYFSFIAPCKEVKASVDDFTGTRSGLTIWFWLIKRDQWETKSELEKRLVKMGIPITRHWVTYMGDGKNLWGRVMIRGHGRPSGSFQITLDLWKDYLKSKDDAEVVRAYSILKSGDSTKIDSFVEGVLDWLVTQ